MDAENRDSFFETYFQYLPPEIKMRIFTHANNGVWKTRKWSSKGDIITYKMYMKRKIIANIPRGLCQGDVQPNPLGPLIISKVEWSKRHRCYVTRIIMEGIGNSQAQQKNMR